MHVQVCSFSVLLSLPTLTSSLSTNLERRAFLVTSVGIFPTVASAKCTDIESCREIGDEKVAQDVKDNPVTRLKDEVRFKQLKPGYGDGSVQPSSTVDVIYSISRAGGPYMYSQGFGYEKVDIGHGLQSDLGLDSYRVALGKGGLPVGIEEALVGMKKGERRRIELPPTVGLETSNWKPQPTSNLGKTSLVAYQRILKGFGSQPPFPAPTIWDVEVLSFRN